MPSLTRDHAIRIAVGHLEGAAREKAILRLLQNPPSIPKAMFPKWKLQKAWRLNAKRHRARFRALTSRTTPC